jgi:PilZ domain
MISKNHKLSGQSEPSLDRRSSERISSVYRPVLLETEEFAGFCLVRNLSPGGMMGSVYTQFAENQPVTVQFHPDHVISATISWSKEGQIGIQFDEEINVADMLRKLADKHIGTKVNRAPRLQIECDGGLELDGRSIPMRLRDISQRGIKAQVSHLKPGDEVLVRLPGLEPHKALVRWTQSGLAGLNFVRTISFEELAVWVIGRQSQHGQ